MYIKIINANIDCVIISIFLISLFLIFPLFLNGSLYYANEYKKVFFNIRLFGVVKIIGGYGEFIKDGIAFHLTKNKAIIFTTASVTGMKKKMKPLKDYHFLKIRSVIELGGDNSLEQILGFSFLINYIDLILKWYLNNIKPYLVYDNKINIYEDKNVFKVYFDSTIVLNLLMVLISIIKILVEKIIYAIKIRKQQN